MENIDISSMGRAILKNRHGLAKVFAKRMSNPTEEEIRKGQVEILNKEGTMKLVFPVAGGPPHKKLEEKADRAATKAVASDCLAVTAGLCTVLSAVSANPQPHTVLDITLNWAIDGVHMVNEVVSAFMENVLSIQVSDKAVGIGMGIATAAAATLYGCMQRKKASQYRAQADEIIGKNETNAPGTTHTPQPGY